MTAPRRVMRSASHLGTRPPCSGRAALPARRAIPVRIPFVSSGECTRSVPARRGVLLSPTGRGSSGGERVEAVGEAVEVPGAGERGGAGPARRLVGERGDGGRGVHRRDLPVE